MAVAKVEPLTKFDMGSNIVPCGKRLADGGGDLRNAVPRESDAEGKQWNAVLYRKEHA